VEKENRSNKRRITQNGIVLEGHKSAPPSKRSDAMDKTLTITKPQTAVFNKK